MAIVFDSSTGASNGSWVTTATVSHNHNPSGANDVLLAFIANRDTQAVTNVTWDGDSIFSYVGMAADTAVNAAVWCWGTSAPKTGTYNLVGTIGGTSYAMHIVAMTLSGASLTVTGEIDSGNPDSSTWGHTCNSPNSNELVIHAMKKENQSGTPGVGAGETMRTTTTTLGHWLSVATEHATATTTVMQFTGLTTYATAGNHYSIALAEGAADAFVPKTTFFFSLAGLAIPAAMGKIIVPTAAEAAKLI